MGMDIATDLGEVVGEFEHLGDQRHIVSSVLSAGTLSQCHTARHSPKVRGMRGGYSLKSGPPRLRYKSS
jgi:hypothetical protein